MNSIDEYLVRGITYFKKIQRFDFEIYLFRAAVVTGGKMCAQSKYIIIIYPEKIKVLG